MKAKDLRDKIKAFRDANEQEIERGIAHNETNTLGFRDNVGRSSAYNVVLGILNDMLYETEIDPKDFK